MIKYTPEQYEVLEHMQENDGILLVAAGAGTGKTFLAKQVVKTLEPKSGLYTAFNKAIVEEGTSRFAGTNMECKTLHALAYKYVQPSKKIEDFSYTCIEEDLSYRSKWAIIDAVNSFYVSASTDMYEFFEEFFKDEDDPQLLEELCEKYVNRMVEGKMNPTFNFMLKYFHLCLVNGSAKAQYDLVILDEINDTTAVALEIFKLIDAPKKLGLGETHQAIYDFLNLVNGFEELEDVPVLHLTQSFRCSERIAAGIQNFMRHDLTDDFTFVGTDEPVQNGKTLYCTSTNAKIINEINNRLETGQRFHLLRKISDIFACPMAIVTASGGKKPYQKKYFFLLEEYQNYERNRSRGQSYMQYLADNVDDEEIQAAVRLLSVLRKKNVNIFDLYKKAQSVEPDFDYVIATVYTSKGLEFETVIIGDDLNNRINTVRDNGGVRNHDDVVSYRCYYVACSRAGEHLINASALNVRN